METKIESIISDLVVQGKSILQARDESEKSTALRVAAEWLRPKYTEQVLRNGCPSSKPHPIADLVDSITPVVSEAHFVTDREVTYQVTGLLKFVIVVNVKEERVSQCTCHIERGSPHDSEAVVNVTEFGRSALAELFATSLVTARYRTRRL